MSHLKDIIINEIASCASHIKVYQFKISYASFKECSIFVEEKTILLSKDLFQEINADMDYEITSKVWDSIICKHTKNVQLHQLGLENSNYTDVDCFQTTNGSEYCSEDIKSYARINSIVLIN